MIVDLKLLDPFVTPTNMMMMMMMTRYNDDDDDVRFLCYQMH